jgi:hypothetical protein
VTEDILGPDGSLFWWNKSLNTRAAVDHTGARTFFYVPDLNRELHERGLPTLQLIKSSLRKNAHMFQLATFAQNSVQVERRALRCLIINVAMAIWSGGSVNQVFRAVGRGVCESQAYYMDPNHYEYMRSRWAPTNKLGDFLFPKWLVDDNRMACPYQESLWLEDPTIRLLGNSTRTSDLSNKEIVAATHKMLNRLTLLPGLGRDRGSGVMVSVWVDAARAYHRERLIEELEEGLVLHMKGIAPDELGHSRYNRLDQLRDKLGLRRHVPLDQLPAARRGRDYALPPPPRPCVATFKGTVAEFRKADQDAKDRAADYEARFKAFNRIIQETCTICPVTRECFEPVGLEGLLVSALFRCCEFAYTL